MQDAMTLTFLPPSFGLKLALPLASFPVSAGFPSPADDHLEGSLDLNEYIIRHPAATFYVRASGDSMRGAGIFDGDLLIVDRAAACADGAIVVARLGDEFTLKRILKKGNSIFLRPENDAYPPIEVTEDSDCEIWGRVIGSVRRY
jgi:DNA polymerase V